MTIFDVEGLLISVLGCLRLDDVRLLPNKVLSLRADSLSLFSKDSLDLDSFKFNRIDGHALVDVLALLLGLVEVDGVCSTSAFLFERVLIVSRLFSDSAAGSSSTLIGVSEFSFFILAEFVVVVAAAAFGVASADLRVDTALGSLML